jgi:hypothetical protein
MIRKIPFMLRLSKHSEPFSASCGTSSLWMVRLSAGEFPADLTVLPDF